MGKIRQCLVIQILLPKILKRHQIFSRPMMNETIRDLISSIVQQMPKNVNSKLNEMAELFENLDKMLDAQPSQLIIKLPLVKIQQRLLNKDLNPVQAMKSLVQLEEWIKMIYDGVRQGLKIPSCISEEDLKKLQNLYYQQKGCGKVVKLGELLQMFNSCVSIHEEKTNTHDITSSNVIIVLTDIVKDAEEFILDIFPDIREDLEQGIYSKCNISDLNINSLWAKRQIEQGMFNSITITQAIVDYKSKLEQSIQNHKLFKPLLNEAHIIINVFPIIMTMLFEDVNGIEKLRNDCNNILTEFSYGAQLERLTISLKEKIIKKRDISELQINADAIKKEFQKIKDALNHEILSYLRRMKLQTIIDDRLFNDAINIGIDLTGLNSKFGIKKAPQIFNDVKLETGKKFSIQIQEFIRAYEKRVSEEIENGIAPNLHTLFNLIYEMKKTIERDFQLIPTHIGPVFGGLLQQVNEIIEQISLFFEPLKYNSLILLLNDPQKKNDFYSVLNKYYISLEDSYKIYKEFIEIGIALAGADQNLAIKFSSLRISEQDHNKSYMDLFENSLNTIKQMKAMNTLTEEEATIARSKVEKANKLMQKFVNKYRFEDLQRIIKLNVEC